MTVSGNGCFFSSISRGKDELAGSKKKGQGSSSLRRRIKKVWRRRVLGGTDDETQSLLRNDKQEDVKQIEPQSATNRGCKSLNESSTSSSSSTSQSDTNKKKKKRTLLKRFGKAALTTCRYIGIGAQSLTGPGIMPHGHMSYDVPSGLYRGPFNYDHPPDVYYSYSYPPDFYP